MIVLIGSTRCFKQPGERVCESLPISGKTFSLKQMGRATDVQCVEFLLRCSAAFCQRRSLPQHYSKGQPFLCATHTIGLIMAKAQKFASIDPPSLSPAERSASFQPWLGRLKIAQAKKQKLAHLSLAAICDCSWAFSLFYQPNAHSHTHTHTQTHTHTHKHTGAHRQ